MPLLATSDAVPRAMDMACLLRPRTALMMGYSMLKTSAFKWGAEV